MSDAKPALFAIAAPLILAGLLATSAGALWLAGWLGRDATGVDARITVASDCPEEWAERMTQRAESIGLGQVLAEVVDGKAVLTATLPGLEDDLQAMPLLLTQPGRFGVFSGLEPEGEPLATEADIVGVELGLNLKGHPYVQLELQPSAVLRLQEAGSPMAYVLDGEILDRYQVEGPVRGDEIRIQARLDTIKDELRAATDWNIVLRHGPAPCAAGEVGIEVLP